MAHNDRLIDTLGVSKRLGRSVLSELDSRANEKAAELDSVLDDANKPTSTNPHRFKAVHQSEFSAMDSIESHYAAKKAGFSFQKDELHNISASNGLEKSQRTKENSNERPSTPKRHANQELSASTKRYKDSKSRSRASDAFLYSPVTDITKKIRRLRMIGQTPRENKSRMNTIRNTPLSRRDPGYLSVTGYVPQNFDRNQPTFAKPTFTSIKRESKPGAIFSNLKKPGSIPRTHINYMLPHPPPSKPTPVVDTPPHHPVQKPSMVASTSVFDRLYKQSTISRSSSSNKLPAPTRPLPKSQTMKNIRSSAVADNMKSGLAPSSFSLPRSKSSANLSIGNQSRGISVKQLGETNLGKRNWR